MRARLGIVGALTTSAFLALASLASAQSQRPDPRLAAALADTLSADAAGQPPAESLRPILRLPQRGCYRPGATADDPCLQTYGPYFQQPPLREAAIGAIPELYFDDNRQQSRPSLALTRAALDRMAQRRESAFAAAHFYARLGDRARAEFALRRSGADADERRLHLGLWFSEIDAATAADLRLHIAETRLARITSGFSSASSGQRVSARVATIEAARAAGRTDLELELSLAQLRDHWGAERQALASLDRVIELGGGARARAVIDAIAAQSNIDGAGSAVWVATLGYLRLAERERAQLIAAPWLTAERNPPCGDDGGPNLYPFLPGAPWCRLGPHLETALARHGQISP